MRHSLRSEASELAAATMPDVPRYSVVIPAYNAARSLTRLLDVLTRPEFTAAEIIVVSDASSDDTDDVASVRGARLLRNPVRRGAGAARNLGARAAAAPFLIFLDADVVPAPDLLQRIDAHRAAQPNMRCFIGVYSLRPAVDGWFQRYRAVLNYTYVHDLPVVSSSTLFVTAVAGIDAALFTQSGGFDESDSAKNAEDTEFGYRIARWTPIYLLRDVEVQHEFPDFVDNLRTYFRRSESWVRLYGQHRTFDNHTTTVDTALLRGLGALAGCVSFAALVVPGLRLPASVLHGSYIVANRRFLGLLLRHAPFSDLPRLYAADLCLCVSVLAGALRGAASIVAARRAATPAPHT